jgi:peptide/nickel transport system permease protein
MALTRYILRRLFEIAVIFFVILTVLFLLFRLAPGDPVSRMVDPSWTPEEAEHLVAQLGLNEPLLTQYGYYLKNVAVGQFGVSFHYGEPVVEIIAGRLPNTILLFTTAIIISGPGRHLSGQNRRLEQGPAHRHLDDHWRPWSATPCSFPGWPCSSYGFGLSCRLVSGQRDLTPEIWVDPGAGWWSKPGRGPSHGCCRC